MGSIPIQLVFAAVLLINSGLRTLDQVAEFFNIDVKELNQAVMGYGLAITRKVFIDIKYIVNIHLSKSNMRKLIWQANKTVTDEEFESLWQLVQLIDYRRIAQKSQEIKPSLN